MTYDREEFIRAWSKKNAVKKIYKFHDDKENLCITSCWLVKGYDNRFDNRIDISGFLYEVSFSYDEPKNKFILEEDYACYVCGKKGIKLWRPYHISSHLICAACAYENDTCGCEFIGIKQEQSEEIFLAKSRYWVPAVPINDGSQWCYVDVPEDQYKWWNELPKR